MAEKGITADSIRVGSIRVDWIGVDWGTSRLRAYGMSASGTVLSEAKSDCGMGGLAQSGFEPALLDLVGNWLAPDREVVVIACGMVGSRQGWAEAPYATVPCTPLTERLAEAKVSRSGLRVFIIPGLRQTAPADVMRGEETQIAGFLALNPGWDGVLCLPGSHSKWVHVSAGEVVSFQTCMTGELFAALAQHTVLRHSVGDDGWDNDAFADALDAAMAKPEKLAARLFALRAEHLLHGLAPAAGRARLSGLLIGAELAAAKPYWLGQQVAVIGADALASAYVTALSAQGVPATQVDAPRATLAGLTQAWRNLKKDVSQ